MEAVNSGNEQDRSTDSAAIALERLYLAGVRPAETSVETGSNLPVLVEPLAVPGTAEPERLHPAQVCDHCMPHAVAAPCRDREADTHTRIVSGPVPKLDDAFEKLHDSVRLANEDFRRLFMMLEPHLQRHLFNGADSLAPWPDSEAAVAPENHPSRGPEYSPTYSKVIDAIEAIRGMRRSVDLIVRHLVV